MSYQDVEYKLAQYAQWCGNPLRSLGFPGRPIYARAIPDAIDADALPDMTDEEAQAVGSALLALKRFNDKAYTAIVARFFANMNDDDIGRRYGFGTRKRVYEKRMRGYWFLAGRLL